MSGQTSYHYLKTTTLDVVTKIGNLNYISKFKLPTNIAYYINLRSIVYNVHINKPIIASNIEFNS